MQRNLRIVACLAEWALGKSVAAPGDRRFIMARVAHAVLQRPVNPPSGRVDSWTL